MSILLLALSLAQTAATPAPPPAAEPSMAPPPAFTDAAQAFGQCIGRNSAAAPATATPEAAARSAIGACATEQATMTTQFESWVSGPTCPAAYREPARAQFKAQMDGLPAQVGAKLAERRNVTPPAAQAGPDQRAPVNNPVVATPPRR